jgi:dolichol-phosphate mannosyltransferase
MSKNNNKILIIIPTYNEADNIEPLIKEIFRNRNDVDILIIDDNSPDGTAEIVEKLEKTYDVINLIKRSGKMGYGSACQEGFTWALKCKNYKYFITMDADFSHHPKYINDILGGIEEKSIVLGSRYIEGGGVENWGIHRKILSRGANLYSRCILNIPVNDCTSGFRCYRREVIEKIDLNAITSEGYSFLEEMLYICKLQDFSILEVPIVFENRKYGKSKINKMEIFKAIIKVPKLRLLWKYL